MPARDVFQRTDDLEPATLAALGERLEFRGSEATFSRMRDAYFDRLPLAGARAVLDVGCGTGVVARALLGRPGFGGRLVAVDLSPGASIGAAAAAPSLALRSASRRPPR